MLRVLCIWCLGAGFIGRAGQVPVCRSLAQGVGCTWTLKDLPFRVACYEFFIYVLQKVGYSWRR